MKSLIFSLIFGLFLFCPIVNVNASATPSEIADFIKNQTNTGTNTNLTPELLDFMNQMTSEQQTDFKNKFNNGASIRAMYPGINEEDEFYLTFKEGQTLENYLKAIEAENIRRKALGQTNLLPNPTIQINPNAQPDIQLPAQNPVQVPDSFFATAITSNDSLIKTATDVTLFNSIIPESMFNQDTQQPLNKLLNQIFYIGLIVAISLAIIMIIRGGVEYMTIDSITGKESGKSRIKAALGGLLLAFSAIMILNTINPGLTKLDIKFEELKQVASAQIQIKAEIESGLRNPDGTWIVQPIGGDVNSKFTDAELEAYTLQKIKEMGFANLNPTDKAAFFPNGGTDEEWLALVSAIITHESDWDPNNQYASAYGLMQLNAEAMKGYAKWNPNLANLTNQDLYNPKTNIDAGLTVLKRLVERDGYISGPSYAGAAQYWAVLRSEKTWDLGKLTELKNTMKK